MCVVLGGACFSGVVWLFTASFVCSGGLCFSWGCVVFVLRCVLFWGCLSVDCVFFRRLCVCSEDCVFVLRSVSFDGYCVFFWGVCVFLGGGGREEGFWEC